MRQRRVLVFNHFAVPRGHPGGTRHVELFSKLAGWSYLIIAGRLNLTTGRPQRAEAGFHPVPVLPYRGNGAARILNWLSYAVTATLAGLRAPRPDVVYASSPHLLAGLAGWLVARLRRSRFVLEVRDLWPRVLVDMGHLREASLRYRLLERLELFLYRRADRIVVLAEGTAAAIALRGVPTDRVVRIPNAADPEDFLPSAPREELRRRYGFDRLTAVYTGAHGPANGLGALLDAAKLVPEVDLVLVGSGVEKPWLQAAAAANQIANLRFLDPVPKTEMPDLLAAADVGLHVLADVPLFRSSVSPNKVFDYLAAGLPVVTNSLGVVGALVVEAAAGYVTAPDDLARGLREVRRATARGLAAHGAAGRAWISGNQSRSAMARRLGELLDQVSGEAARAPRPRPAGTADGRQTAPDRGDR